jgi:Zn-dependent peptidase ImmA (M78 family)/DNA-binding XRE family transcriptional regulator
MAPLNPSRLDLARRRRGFTKGALAKAAEIAPRTLTAYERGETEPDERVVARLAAALGFPVAFFAKDDADEPSIDGVSFRALSSMTARQRDQARGAAAIALELDQWMRDRFDLPGMKVPRLRGMDAEAAAEAVRVEWGLGEQVAPNMVHLLEAHGVRVFSLVQECAEVDAFSFWHDGTPYVFLNGMKTAERSRMDAAHELGHLVLHYWGGPKGRPAEQEAQLFGASFLMPRRDVLATMPRGATIPQIIEARKRWRVAAMNLAVRLAKLGLLTEWQARSSYIQLGQRGFRDGEPGGIERETSQVWDKVFAALRCEGMSRADVARQLNVSLEDLNAPVFGLVVPKGIGRPKSATATTPAGRPKLEVVKDTLT